MAAKLARNKKYDNSGRVIVAGLGPSINEYPRSIFKDYYTIGVNNIDSEIKDIDIIYDVEHRPENKWQHDGEWHSTKGYSAGMATIEHKPAGLKRLRNGEKAFEFIFDIESSLIPIGQSSIIGALWIAAKRPGVKEIYLIGVDLQVNEYGHRYFFERQEKVYYGWYLNEAEGKYQDFLYQLAYVKKHLAQHNIKLYIATKKSNATQVLNYKKIEY